MNIDDSNQSQSQQLESSQSSESIPQINSSYYQTQRRNEQRNSKTAQVKKIELQSKTPFLKKIMDSIQTKNQNLMISETLIAGIIQLSESVYALRLQVQNLEYKVRNCSVYKQTIQPKRKRRKAMELQKSYICPIESCLKCYASDISLNLHLRLKHKNKIKNKNSQILSKQNSFVTDELQPVQARFQLPVHIRQTIESEYQKLIHQQK